MQKGNYTIELQDGTKIPIRFTTWGFRRFSEEKGISVDEFEATLKNGLLRTEDLVRLILFAAEWQCKSEKKDFKYEEFDVWNWVDDMGGTRSPQLIEIGQILISVYFGLELSEVKRLFEVQVEKMEAEKKEEVKPEQNGHEKEEKKSELPGGRYIRGHVKQD